MNKWAGFSRMLLVLVLLGVAEYLFGCILDFKWDCRIIEDKLKEAKPAEIYSLAEVYRMNGCTEHRIIPNQIYLTDKHVAN